MLEFTAKVLFAPESEELRFLPEGPQWAGDGLVSWVAIQHGASTPAGSLNLLDLATGANRRFDLSGRPGFAFPTAAADTFVLGLERRVVVFNAATGAVEPLTHEVDTDVAGTIINDGEMFPAGLVFGCKDLNFAEKKAGLYFWRRMTGDLRELRADQICSNGKVLQPIAGERWRLFDIDSPTKTVVAYDFDADRGTLENEQIVIDFRAEEVFPDGMVATPDGQSVIIAFYDPRDSAAGEARQYRLADGALEAVWRVPGSPRVTCPLLLEWQGSVKLVLTTAVEHMPAEERARRPHAGALFIAETPWQQIARPMRWAI